MSDFWSNLFSTTIGVVFAFYLQHLYSVSQDRKSKAKAKRQLLTMLQNGLESNQHHLDLLTTRFLPQKSSPSFRLARAHFEGTVQLRADIFSDDPEFYVLLEYLSFEMAHINQKLENLAHREILVNSLPLNTLERHASEKAYIAECAATLGIGEHLIGEMERASRRIKDLATKDSIVTGDTFEDK